MNILITGSSGFIGGYVSRSLKNSGHNVLAFNRQLPNEFIATTVDVVVHCAANAVIRENGKPSDIWDSNLKLTHDLLESVTVKSKPLFVNLSSIAVYGEHSEPPTENDQTYPLTNYGISKLASEMVVNKYHREGKVNAANLRLGGVCGPHMTHGILKRILYACKDQQSSIEFINPAPGNNMSYVHVSTIVGVIQQLMINPKLTTTYNVTATNTMNITEIVNKCNSLSGNKMKIIWKDGPANFVNDRSIFIGNTNLVHRLLGVDTFSTQRNIERAAEECFL